MSALRKRRSKPSKSRRFEPVLTRLSVYPKHSHKSHWRSWNRFASEKSLPKMPAKFAKSKGGKSSTSKSSVASAIRKAASTALSPRKKE
jgi:hypothetical protein